ncbi:MAG: hypothetical protein GX897_07425 [Clostridiales bacterium]|nr:hypothetical protein [Clostridiales bacterium]
MTVFKRLLFIALAAAMLLTALACGSNSGKSGETTAPDATAAAETTEATTEPPYEFLKNPEDFGGREFKVLNGAYTKGDYIDLDDSVKRGDVIVEAVYERNSKTEELLNIKITSTKTEDWTAIGADIQKIVMAGDGEYSAVFGSIEKVSGTLDKHYLIDMNTVETMDMTHPWWDKEVIDIFGFGTGKAFMACGEINFWDDLSTVCLYFNKSLMAANNIPYPYDAVRDNQWTCDAFKVLVTNAYLDLNGNGETDEYDQYGYVCTASHAFNMMVGFDTLTVVPDSEGKYEFILDEEYFVKFSRAINDFCNTDATVVKERKFGYDLGGQIFSFGNTYFDYSMIGSCLSYRALEFDIGVVPFPKFDENQEKYHGVCNTMYANVYGIPAGADAEFAGTVLETMSWFAMPQLKEAVIDTSVLIKGVRDQDSYDMFHIIFDSKTYDLIYNFNWGGFYGKTCDMVISGKDKLASTYASVKKATDKEMAKFIEAVQTGAAG